MSRVGYEQVMNKLLGGKIMKKTALLLSTLLVIPSVSFAQQTPQDANKGKIQVSQAQPGSGGTSGASAATGAAAGGITAGTVAAIVAAVAIAAAIASSDDGTTTTTTTTTTSN